MAGEITENNMADSIVGGLFGADPAVLQAQQQQADLQNAAAYAQMTPMQRATASTYQGAAGLGRAVGGMLGMQDPMLAKATMAKQLASQFNITTPEGLQQYAQALAQNGAPDLAQIAIQRANTMATSAAEIGLKQAQTVKALREPDEGTKALIGKSTPESVAAYMKSGNIADLQLIDKGLTGTALDKVSAAQQNIANLSATNVDIDTWMTKVNPKDPKVTFGPLSSVAHGVTGMLGSPTENALEQDSLRRFIAREANDILVAAKGTQTEGDAKRAYEQIMSGLDKNSNAGVYNALEDLKKAKGKTVTGLETYVNSMTSKGKPMSAPSAPSQNAIFSAVRAKKGWEDASDAEIQQAISAGKIKVPTAK